MRPLLVVGLTLVVACGDPSGDGDRDAAVDRCPGLDLAACRAEPGCVADTCITCTCTPDYLGCRAADAAPHDCPEVGCAQPECCRTQEHCTTGGSCAIEPPPGCGICNPAAGDCTDDNGCTGDDLCEPIPCSCEGARHCVPGCETTGCALGQVCDADRDRCVEAPCSEARTECPANFVCTWPEGGCLRKDCTVDENCPAGWCVLGFCQESLGACYLPPP
jgi:hypothetical protein